MEHIDDVVRQIEQRIPGVRTRVERTVSPRGPVWVGVSHGRHGAAIEWQQGMGYGLTSLPTEGIGEGSDEVYDSVSELVDRLESLLTSGARTQWPREAVLRTIRERRRVSQEALAQLLGVSQPNISRLERRVDMNVGTLRAVIEAIGGRLEIVARFGNEAVRITQFDDPDGLPHARRR